MTVPPMPPQDPYGYGNNPYPNQSNYPQQPPRRRIPWWVWVVIASGLLALLVCGGILWTIIRAVHNAEDPQNAPNPAPSSLQIPEPSATPSATARHASKADEAKFLLEIHNHDGFGNVPEDKVLKTGYAVCTAFDSGNSYDSLVTAAKDGGVTEADGKFIINSAVTHLCPEYKTALPSN